jgi:hypothetical protein
MWMAHALGDRPVPEVGLTVERQEGAIKLAATVTSATTIKAVTAWSATDDRGAYLKSKWNPTPMVGNKGRYQAAVPAPAGSHTAFFVEVEDEDPQAGRGVISTGMQEVKP